MVRTYVRKTEKAAYSKEKLQEAVGGVRSGRLSGYGASKLYNIPRMTIMDHLNGRRGVKSKTLGKYTVIPTDVEKKLADNLHVMEKYGFGLSKKEVIELVGNFINQNNLQSPFKYGYPGHDWYYGFSKRHNLSIKKPQAVEYSRKKACDPFIIKEYFDILESTITELGLHDKPSQIWNLDETSFSRDPARTKVVGKRGYASTRTISSTGKDNTSVLLECNANGDKAPPLIIFKGKNVWDEWTSPEAYPDTTYASTKNGWMESDVFEKYFLKSFLKTVGTKRPILLIYDGHKTHVQLNLIKKACSSGITIIKLPSHSSHLLQPLDISTMKSFKNTWDERLVKWQRYNIGVNLPKKEFSKMLGDVWSAIEPQVIINGFKKGGIWPFNSQAISDDKFDPVTLQRWKDQQASIRSPLQPMDVNCTHTVVESAKTNGLQTGTSVNIPPLIQDCNRITILEDKILENSDKISFEELILSKLKKGAIVKKKKTKMAAGAEVITHTDVIERIQQNIDKKKKVSEKQLKRKKPSLKTRLVSTSEGSDISSIENIESDSDPEDMEDYINTYLSEDENTSPGSWNVDKLKEEEHVNLPETKQVGNWILVQFATKKSLKHYIGNIIKITEHSMPMVKYVRRSRNHIREYDSVFCYPMVDDIIGRRGQIIFKMSFDKYNVQ